MFHIEQGRVFAHQHLFKKLFAQCSYISRSVKDVSIPLRYNIGKGHAKERQQQAISSLQSLFCYSVIIYLSVVAQLRADRADNF